MTLMATEKRIKVTRTEAFDSLARVLRGSLTKGGIDLSQSTDEDVEGAWNQMRHDAEPGTYGAAWLATVDAWCDETQGSARPVYRRILDTVRDLPPKKRTRYQATHRPIKVAEVECPESDAFEAHGANRVRCTVCNRILRRRVRHQPGEDGKFGWIEHYRNGSTYFVEPDAH